MPTKWWQRYLPTPSARPEVALLKQWIWIYIVLWLFEGSLRKWILPNYAAPLLLIRDPVALFIVVYAVYRNLWKLNLWVIVLWVVGFVSFLVTLSLGIPVSVGIVGLRTVVLHYPLIFIMGRTLSRADVDRIGNIILDLSLPVSLLMVLQFSSSPDSFINVGAGVDAMQLEAVEGKIRAPGIFSYISGAAQYYSLVAAFFFAKVADRTKTSYFALSCGGIGLLLALSVAISRTLSASVAIVVAAFLFACLGVGIHLKKLVYTFCFLVIVGLIVSQSSLVQDGFDAFKQRWSMAGDSEGSFLTRAFGSVSVDWETLSTAGLRGAGLGVGTNMGAKLMTGDVGFQLAEGEWDRVVLEMGAVLGITFIAWRVALLFALLRQSLQALKRKDVLAILIFSTGGLTLLNGQSGVPATLGFLALSCGLALAAAESQAVFKVQDGVLIQMRPQRNLRRFRSSPLAAHRSG